MSSARVAARSSAPQFRLLYCSAHETLYLTLSQAISMNLEGCADGEAFWLLSF